MAFVDELFSAARPHPIENHPFIVAARTGTLSPEEIRSFGMHMASATRSFVRALYMILGVCDDMRVRHSLIGNLLEEEGAISYVPEQGVSFDPAKHHPSMARRFARACGASETAIDSFDVGPPRWFLHALRNGNWMGPFAYIAVGTEANIPPTYRHLIPALATNYRFSESDLEFLQVHLGADDRHGYDGAVLIESVATDSGARRQALEGARRGGNGWWRILRKHITV